MIFQEANMWIPKFFPVVVLCCLFIAGGCQGTRVVVESEAPQERSPGYQKGGPPPWAPAHGYRAKHRYRYYPGSRVYYEVDKGLYFYYRDGRWTASVSLPSVIRIDVDDYITLEMDSDRPYEYDEEVMRRYPPGQWKKGHQKKGKKKWD